MMGEGQALEVAESPIPVDDAETQAQLGALLVAARERCNLSAADLARQLRLGLRQVQALEENRFDVLPGNTFVRGFIRNYARVVQTDAEVFLNAYEQNRPRPQQPKIEHSNAQINFQQSSTPKWVWYLISLIGLLIATPLLIYFSLRDDGTPIKPRTVASLPTSAPIAAPLGAPVLLPIPQAVLQSSAAGTVTPGVAVTSPLQSSIPATNSPAPPTPNVSLALGEASIALSFLGDVWLEIRDKSGKVIYSQLSRKGEEQAIQGKPPFTLVVGNASQVRIAYNGKSVDLQPHTKVNVARLKLE